VHGRPLVAAAEPQGGGRADCCWHHGINWHLVSETAIGIALQAKASGTSPEDTFDALDLAACGLTGDDQTGLVLLLGPSAGIELDDEDPADVTIYEGRHRITAMRDAGVLRTSSNDRKSPLHRRRRYLTVMRNVVFSLDDPTGPIAAIITEAVIANATDYGTKVAAVDPETIGYQIIDALREYGPTITKRR
jgi:hypothetical protein